MNLLQLVLKQMRQRALGTSLTLLSVLLGVALAASIVIVLRGADNLLGQKSFGYDVIIGTKASPLQLVVNTVYHISTSPGNIPYAAFEQLEHDPTFRALYRTAVPFGVGDSYKGFPIVGTLPRILGFDDETLQPKTGYDSMGRPLPGFLPASATDDEVEASNGKQKRAGVFEYRTDQKLILAQGRPFARDRFECVLGSEVAAKTDLKIGSQFQATHGFPREGEVADIHKPKWTVVGILEPTRTANDRCLFIGLTSFYCIAEHGTGLIQQKAIRDGTNPDLAVKALKQEEEEAAKEHKELAEKAAAAKNAAPAAATAPAAPDDDEPENFTLNPDGTIQLIPKILEARAISAIMVKTRAGGYGVQQFKYIYRARADDVGAVSPGEEMRTFFDNFINNYSLVLLIVSFLVTVVAAIGILVSIYNSVAARMKEIAILRALGATRTTVLAMICTEAGLIGLFGSLAGVTVGHFIAAIGSNILERQIGSGIPWQHISPIELGFIGGAVLLAALAGLVPALKAYRVPVATNLTA